MDRRRVLGLDLEHDTEFLRVQCADGAVRACG
jgi:hypothetical protein